MSIKEPVKTVFLLTLMAFCFSGPVFAGAWTRDKGGFYAQLTGNDYAADEYFDDDGDREDFADDGEFTDRNAGVYMEYGLRDDLTAIGSWSYKWLEYEDDVIINKTRGLSDLELGLKYRLLTTGRGSVVSAQALVKIPEAYDDDDDVPLGNGQYDYEARLLYGQALYPHFPGYFNTEIAYRFRAEDPADEWKYLAEAGVDFTKTLYGRVKLDGTLGMDNAGKGSDAGGNPSATLDYDLGKLEASLGWKAAKQWGLELGYRPEIYGKNISAGVNWSLALVYQNR
jgi:protein XagA